MKTLLTLMLCVLWTCWGVLFLLALWRRFRARQVVPLLSKFPESWVTLIFVTRLHDLQVPGQWRNMVEHFDSELEAGHFLESARPDLLEGFKGAYKEIPGFLASVAMPEKYKTRIVGPSMPGPAATPPPPTQAPSTPPVGPRDSV